MKILFTGGGTGGHFYPVIAVAEAVRAMADQEHIIDLKMYYMSDAPIDETMLKQADLEYVEVQAGKKRTYASTKNTTDKFKVLVGCIQATWKLFQIYPDVVFGKGGYASFPAMFAAKLLRIPVIIHESDIIPGRVNTWIADYATKIAISYPEAATHFSRKDRIALTGQPIRKALLEMPKEDPYQELGLEPGVPVILVLGGSQGSAKINEHVIDILPRLVDRCQVVHQTGEANLEWMKKRAEGALPGHPHASRYHPAAFLDPKTMRLAAKASSLVVSRAGSAIFEIAIWEKPSILIPLAIARDDHQRANAYSYARTGACTVIEEANLRPELFYSVIESIMLSAEIQTKMIDGAKTFTKTDAADKIARAILAIASAHD